MNARALSRSFFEIEVGLDRIRDAESRRHQISDYEIERCLNAIESATVHGDWRQTTFNLFDVLSIHRLERPHSAILAWLLDPKGAHGLNDQVLCLFLGAAQLSHVGRRVVEVTRERKFGNSYIDIHVQGAGWALFIENKVDALETPDQTTRYARWMRPRDRGLFLTLRGQAALSPRFRPIAYSEVRRMLESLHAEGEAAILINHLIDHIFSDLET